MPKGQRIGEELKDRIVDMTLAGHTQSEIAKIMNCSPCTIYRIQKERCCEPLNSRRRGAPNFVTKKEEEKPKESWTILNRKTVELVGVRTGFKYTTSTGSKDLVIDTGYCPTFSIDIKDLVGFANELMSVAESAEKMRNNRWEE